MDSPLMVQTAPENAVQVMIRDLPEVERPRERLLQYGANLLNNQELLAILLRVGTRGESALALGQRLLSTYGGLRGIAGAAYGEMSTVKGISAAKYCELMAALELGRRLASSSVEERVVIRVAQDVANLLMAEMSLLKQEHLRVLLLNTKNHVAGIHQIYVGTANTSLVRAAEVFLPAIRENSPAIILVHNHPSGDPTPSRQDMDLTRQLRQAGAVLNVELMDHIILGDGNFVSIKDKGWAPL